MKVFSAFLKTRSTGVWRYFLEQVLFLFLQMIPGIVGLSLRGIFYKVIIKSAGVFGLEENVQICHSVRLRLGKNVFIGRNSYIGASGGGIMLGDNACLLDGCYLNVFDYDDVAGGKNRIVIGKDVVLSHGCTIHGHSGVTIGDNTIVGPNTVFVSGDHGQLKKGADYRQARIFYDTPIVVGSNVWIGTNVSILPGIKIGDNAVIGAGSVVTKDIPANTVHAGNPAQLIRELT